MLVIILNHKTYCSLENFHVTNYSFKNYIYIICLFYLIFISVSRHIKKVRVSHIFNSEINRITSNFIGKLSLYIKRTNIGA